MDGAAGLALGAWKGRLASGRPQEPARSRRFLPGARAPRQRQNEEQPASDSCGAGRRPAPSLHPRPPLTRIPMLSFAPIHCGRRSIPRCSGPFLERRTQCERAFAVGHQATPFGTRRGWRCQNVRRRRRTQRVSQRRTNHIPGYFTAAAEGTFASRCVPRLASSGKVGWRVRGSRRHEALAVGGSCRERALLPRPRLRHPTAALGFKNDLFFVWCAFRGEPFCSPDFILLSMTPDCRWTDAASRLSAFRPGASARFGRSWKPPGCGASSSLSASVGTRQRTQLEPC